MKQKPIQEKRHLEMYSILINFLIGGHRYLKAAKAALGDYTLQSQFFESSHNGKPVKIFSFDTTKEYQSKCGYPQFQLTIPDSLSEKDLEFARQDLGRLETYMQELEALALEITSKELLRSSALSKLTPEEKEVLGLAT